MKKLALLLAMLGTFAFTTPASAQLFDDWGSDEYEYGYDTGYGYGEDEGYYTSDYGYGESEYGYGENEGYNYYDNAGYGYEWETDDGWFNDWFDE